MNDLKKIVCISAIRWDDMKQRIQHLMTQLSKDFEVLYVNPAFDYSKALKYKKQKGYFPKEYVKVNDNLHVISPIIPLSIRKIQTINKFLRKIYFSKFVNEYIDKLNFGNEAIVFVSDIYAIDVLKDIKYSKLVYDCCDEVAEFSSSYKEVATRNENYLIENADVLFCSAQNLYDRLIKKNKNVDIVRNAAEYEHFSEAICTSDKGIGFVGAVADWIDTDIIKYLAENLPEEQLHIIGPVSVSIDELKKMSNVKIYGRQDYAQLPELLKKFKVAIAPFKINSLTLSVNPIKFYEYCSAEKITVATRLPELEVYEPNIFIADTKEEFLEKVKIALALRDDEFVKKVKEIGERNSWEARARVMCNVLSKL